MISTGSGRSSITRSSKSPVPRPCKALIVDGSPSPSDISSHADDSWFRSSTLLATTTTDSTFLRNRSATWASSSVMPTVESKTKRTTSALNMACSLWRLTFSSRESPPVIHPPVSIRVNVRSSQKASTSFLSLVTPGRSSTMASRLPMMRFIKVDLPTLGLPTIATTGFIMRFLTLWLAVKSAHRLE